MGQGPQKPLLDDHLQRSKTHSLMLHRRKGLSLEQIPLPVDARFNVNNSIAVQNLIK